MGPEGGAVAGAGGIDDASPNGAIACIGCMLIRCGSMVGDNTFANEGEETVCEEWEDGPGVGGVAFERLAAAEDADSAMFAGVESTNLRFLL